MKRRTILILSSIGGVLIIAVITLYFIFYLQSKRAESITGLLQRADEEISRGYFFHAEQTIREAGKKANSSNTWLMVFKRVVPLCESVKDYSLLYDLSSKAVKDLPGNEEIRAFSVLSSLRTGRYEKAYSEAKKYLNSETYTNLKAEALLRMGVEPDPGESEAGDIYTAIRETLSSRNPEVFEEAAGKLKDPRLYLDASLLWILSGNPQRAYTVFFGNIPAGSYTEAGFFISYDAEEYDRALNLLETLERNKALSSEELLLLRADIHMLEKDYPKAENLYKNVIQASPDYSWIPYLNLAWIAEKRGDHTNEIENLMLSYEKFPDKKEVVLTLSWYLAQQNREENAEEKLQNFLKKYPDDVDAKILRLIIREGLYNEKRYLGSLWELFNLHPDNILLAQYFSWYLIGLGDLEGLKIVLKNFSNAVGDMEWVQFFYGLIYTLKGEYHRAEKCFKISLEQNFRWETSYNLGVLYLFAGDVDTALEYFQRADDYLAGNMHESNIMKKKSIVLTKIGKIMYAKGNSTAAKRHISYALDMDRENLEALFLLKQLEGDNKK